MKKRYIIIPIITLLFLIFQLLKFINLFSGSYHYAEWYIFERQQDDLITIITDFKNQNPEYKAMFTLKSGETEEMSDKFANSYYVCSFYLKEKEIFLSCRTHNNVMDSTQSGIGLVAVQKKDSYRWRLVNKELSGKENKEVKELFETEILNKLGKWQRMPKDWTDFFR
jgi:hypothetical protein